MPYLDVGDGHRIYYEQHGAADGRPAVVLHGGPGGGLQRSALKFFDLRRWRVTLFDQRGCGRSTPSVSEPSALRTNTTWHLVADIEKLRSAVGVTGAWTVFGGSWGSTLALAYASKHMSSVAAIVLRGVFLAEPWESEWLYAEGGASRMAPVEWERFSDGGRRRTLKATMSYYGSRLRSRRAATRKAAARAWNRWETVLSSLNPPKGHGAAPESMAILEHHYFKHHCWLKPGQLLAVAERIPRSIPVTIVQGRYDLVCPPASAVALAHRIPHSVLKLTHAGHSAMEPETARSLRAALSTLHAA
jgi:proline iminopeptidase